MVTGHVREMQLRDPRKVKVVYERLRWNEIFENNPRMVEPWKQGDYQVYHPRVNGLRPYCSAKSTTKWTWKEYKPPVGEIYFDRNETVFGDVNRDCIVIAPEVKRSASPNKDWGRERWHSLMHLMDRAKIGPIVHLGPKGTNRVEVARLIETPTFRQAAAVLSRAKAAIVHEGAMHHAAAVFGIPTIVIYGGYISSKQTGYDSQVNLFTGGEPCGNRTYCEHCQEAMAKITPEMVFEEFRKIYKP
jgi:ADP-heptose:LPS heptosyltransferase